MWSNPHQPHDCQFHWRNRGYADFEDFLGSFTADKRKKARRERRRVQHKEPVKVRAERDGGVHAVDGQRDERRRDGGARETRRQPRH